MTLHVKPCSRCDHPHPVDGMDYDPPEGPATEFGSDQARWVVTCESCGFEGPREMYFMGALVSWNRLYEERKAMNDQKQEITPCRFCGRGGEIRVLQDTYEANSVPLQNCAHNWFTAKSGPERIHADGTVCKGDACEPGGNDPALSPKRSEGVVAWMEADWREQLEAGKLPSVTTTPPRDGDPYPSCVRIIPEPEPEPHYYVSHETQTPGIAWDVRKRVFDGGPCIIAEFSDAHPYPEDAARAHADDLNRRERGEEAP